MTAGGGGPDASTSLAPPGDVTPRCPLQLASFLWRAAALIKSTRPTPAFCADLSLALVGFNSMGLETDGHSLLRAPRAARYALRYALHCRAHPSVTNVFEHPQQSSFKRGDSYVAS